MKINIILFIGLLLLLVIFFLGAYIIGNHAKSVHSHIDDMLKKANETNDKEELNKLLDGLKIYANENCYHNHLMSHAVSVSNYIKGKLNRID